MARPNSLEGLDSEKVAEVALALLALTLHEHCRAWKAMDWDVTDLLYQKGWIADPRGKAKSVLLTEEGLKVADLMLTKHFGKQ